MPFLPLRPGAVILYRSIETFDRPPQNSEERGGRSHRERRNLPETNVSPSLKDVEVHFTPETEKKLTDLAAQSGRGTDEILQDELAGYFDEVIETRETLDSRYDDLKSGRAEPIDGEQFFENLRRREDELLNRHSPR